MAKEEVVVEDGRMVVEVEEAGRAEAVVEAARQQLLK